MQSQIIYKIKTNQSMTETQNTQNILLFYPNTNSQGSEKERIKESTRQYMKWS